MTAEMVLHDEDKLEAIDNQADSTESALPFKDNVLIFNHQWQKIFAFDRSNNSFNKDFFERGGKQEINTKNGDNYIVGIKFISKKGNPYFIIAESKLNIYQVDNLTNILILTFFIIIVIVAIGGWFYTGQALEPVAKIVKQVDAILPTNLESRLSTPKAKDEIGRLVATFNSLLERIHKAFTLQKNFISNVSHELKNPIAVIASQLEVSLAQEERSKTEYKNTLNSVLNDTRELSETIDNLLQLARLHSEDQQKPKMEEVRLDELLLSAREILLKTHKNYRVSFDIEGMPESENDLCVLGSETLLRSAFLNLMENSCKYSTDKSVNVKVIISENGKKNVEISDKGEGIASNEIPLLFQPFYHDPKHKHIKGTGIGLSLVDSILKMHQVPLKISSEEGVGTVFIMEFQ
jgi:signal transduction histidine kinase